MQLHIELVVGAGRERQRLATIKRSGELDSGEGLGLTLEEVKDLVQRLQVIVAAEQAREVEAAKGVAPVLLDQGPGAQGRRDDGHPRL